jgi:hypothetical protein
VETSEKLRALFTEKFGTDWHKEITFTFRADKLYWLAHLAEAGMVLKDKLFKDDHTMKPAEKAASMGSWQLDLEELFERVKRVLTPPAKSSKSSKK